jgi:threonylcarbamoyladenosine tRNA methylthiotransferase MtaB
VKIWVKTFGCRVNQAEGESLKASLLAGGASDSEGFEDADVCVVNTCTVTAEADREALALLRRVTRRNPAARLVVTGCLATRDPELVRTAAPSAVLVGNDAKAEIPAMFGCSPAPAEAALPSLSGRSRAFLKVQDGCNMTCTYCTIPSIRPELSTVPLPDILESVRALAAAGVPEIVLCGIRLGRYLWRAPGEARVDLGGLVTRILEVPGGFRVRLSSLEVTDAGNALLSLMTSSNGRLCPSLHLPLQSGSNSVLKRMNRWYSSEFYRRRVDAYREAVPQGALFTDIITGFPGETDSEHEESFRFAESLEFDGFHIFRYSPRPGTAAAAWKAPDSRVVRARSDQWHALDALSRAGHAARSVGQVRTVAPELSGRDGLTEDFLTVSLDRPLTGGLFKIRVDRAEEKRAFAVVLAR